MKRLRDRQRGLRAAPRTSLAIAAVALCGCGADSRDLEPIKLLHSPPISRQSPEQLRALSMECERYPPHGSFRGRFDAAYCEEAMAEWADSPLQLVVIPDTAGAAK